MAVKTSKVVQLTSSFVVTAAKVVTENRLVKIVTGGTVEDSAAATTTVLGVGLETKAAGELALIQLSGIAHIAASDSAVNAGEYLISDADGKVDTAPAFAGNDGDHFIIGIALADAEAENDVIPVLLGNFVNNSNDAA